jgi:DNA-binding NarL/FixJ family response regulator
LAAEGLAQNASLLRHISQGRLPHVCFGPRRSSIQQEDRAPVLRITPSERSALEFLALGKAVEEIAELWQISPVEVEALLDALFARMGVKSRTEAVAAAFRRGLVAAD